jgi:hypothetical protein
MPKEFRTELEQELVNAFIETKAIDFEKIGQIISKYGARAAKAGAELVFVIDRHNFINCGWPGPEIGRFGGQDIEERRAA